MSSSCCHALRFPWTERPTSDGSLLTHGAVLLNLCGKSKHLVFTIRLHNTCKENGHDLRIGAVSTCVRAVFANRHGESAFCGHSCGFCGHNPSRVSTHHARMGLSFSCRSIRCRVVSFRTDGHLSDGGVCFLTRTCGRLTGTSGFEERIAQDLSKVSSSVAFQRRLSGS